MYFSGIHKQNIEFYLEAPIIAPDFTRIVVSLIDFQMPKIIPNIGLNINDKISFNGSVNGKITIQLPMDYYNVLQFLNTFNTIILIY